MDTQPKRKTKKTPQKREDQVQERRQSLLEAAVKVIGSRGLTGITISTIAAEANCSYGVVAFHFKSKDGIIFAALDHMAEEYETFLTKNNQLDLTPGERIRRMIESDFDGKISNAKRISVWIAYWAEAVRVSKYRARLAELKEYYFTTTRDDIDMLAKARGIEVDAAQISRSLNAMIDGYWITNLVMATAGKEGQGQAKEACFAYMRCFFPDDF
ncbi:MAG: TetR family transcriptional regulator [Rhodobacteraceae bacterium]|nr:TetR family transcriptional regulator [Paracoccaceae bacterium]